MVNKETEEVKMVNDNQGTYTNILEESPEEIKARDDLKQLFYGGGKHSSSSSSSSSSSGAAPKKPVLSKEKQTPNGYGSASDANNNGAQSPRRTLYADTGTARKIHDVINTLSDANKIILQESLNSRSYLNTIVTRLASETPIDSKNLHKLHSKSWYDNKNSMTYEGYRLGPMRLSRIYNLANYKHIMGLTPDQIGQSIASSRKFVTQMNQVGSPFRSAVAGKAPVWFHMINHNIGGGLSKDKDGRPTTGTINGHWCNSFERSFKKFLGSIHAMKPADKRRLTNLNGDKLGLVYTCVASTLSYNEGRTLFGKPPVAWPTQISVSGPDTYQIYLDNRGGIVPAFSARIDFVTIHPNGSIDPIIIEEVDAYLENTKYYAHTFSDFDDYFKNEYNFFTSIFPYYVALEEGIGKD